MGRGSAEAPAHAGQHAARGPAVERGLRARLDDARRRRRPDRRHRRGSAGRAVRPDVSRAGHGEEHLRHRLLSVAEHRRAAVVSRNRLLSTVAWQVGGKTMYALEGSVFIGGAGPVAARRAGHHREVVRRRALARRCRTTAASISPAFAGLGRRTGIPMRAAPSWDHARHDGRPYREGRRREHRVPGRRSAVGRDRRRRHRSDGAARGRRRGRQRRLLQFQADLLGVRSCGRRSPKRPRSARPTSPAWRSASGTRPRRSRATGASTAVRAVTASVAGGGAARGMARGPEPLEGLDRRRQ